MGVQVLDLGVVESTKETPTLKEETALKGTKGLPLPILSVQLAQLSLLKSLEETLTGLPIQERTLETK